MFKKIILAFIFILFVSSVDVMATVAPEPQLKPLQLEEQEHKYGNVEKDLKNPEHKYDSYATQEQNNKRKTSSALDYINTLMLVIISISLCLLIYTRIKGITIGQMFGQKKIDNKFNIISAKQLDNGHTLYLTELNGQQIIVGTTLSKVDSIMPLNQTYSTDEIPPEFIEKLFNNNDSDFKNLEE